MLPLFLFLLGGSLFFFLITEKKGQIEQREGGNSQRHYWKWSKVIATICIKYEYILEKLKIN